MAENSPNGWKMLLEKGEIAHKSNFSFSHGVFERLLPQTHKKPGFVWKITELLEFSSVHWLWYSFLSGHFRLLHLFICFFVMDFVRKIAKRFGLCQPAQTVPCLLRKILLLYSEISLYLKKLHRDK